MDFGAIVRDPKDGTITFTSGKAPRRLVGMGQLLQTLVIELMSDPQPFIGRGSGFVRVLRASPGEDVAVVTSNASRALTTAKNHIFGYQSNDPGLLDSERLQDAKLRNLTTDGQRWFADIEMKSVSGTRFLFTAA